MKLFAQTSSETAEFAFAIKAICDASNLAGSQLLMYAGSQKTLSDIMSDDETATIVRQIPIKIALPRQMAPNKEFDSLILNVAPAEYQPNDDRFGGNVTPGVTEYKVKLTKKSITVWRFTGYSDYYPLGSVVYIINKKDRKALNAFIVAKRDSNITVVQPPILPGNDLKEVYDNTIGFLERGREKIEKYREYNIPYKRGVLLSGKPGCGKTMTCKWLKYLCKDHNLVTRVVTLEEYKHAESRGTIPNLFRLHRNQCGIIFFDDMDVMLKDRKAGNNGHLQTFLTNLDGIEPIEGAVFVFTTNLIEDLDEAFVRPGRIDLFVTFRSPNEKLRTQFVAERFHERLLKQVNQKVIVERTSDYTFAEIDEIRKLLTIDLIDDKDVCIDKTFKVFERHRTEFQERAKFGFGKMEEEIYDDEAVPLPTTPELW